MTRKTPHSDTHPITANELERMLATAGEWAARQSKRTAGVTFAEQTRQLLAAHATGISASNPNAVGGGSDISDPTGNAAIRGEDRTDAWQRQNSEAWRRLHKTIQELDRLAEVAHRQRPRKDRTGIDRAVPMCANPHCREDITDLPLGVVPRRGRCEPCADHFDRRGVDAGPKIINDRRRARERRAETASQQVIAQITSV